MTEIRRTLGPSEFRLRVHSEICWTGWGAQELMTEKELLVRREEATALETDRLQARARRPAAFACVQGRHRGNLRMSRTVASCGVHRNGCWCILNTARIESQWMSQTVASCGLFTCSAMLCDVGIEGAVRAGAGLVSALLPRPYECNVALLGHAGPSVTHHGGASDM
jgi:hypothetical protein